MFRICADNGRGVGLHLGGEPQGVVALSAQPAAWFWSVHQVALFVRVVMAGPAVHVVVLDVRVVQSAGLADRQ